MALGIALTLPTIQTKIAEKFVKSINEDFGVNIAIDEVSLTVFGGVKLKKVLILDHHKDTLIYANRIKTNVLDAKKLLDGDLIFGKIFLDGLYFNLKTYRKEQHTNLDVLINSFDSGKPTTKHFLMTANKATISNGHFILTDQNRIIPKDVDFTKLSISLSKFMIYGPDVNTVIEKMSFKDHRGIFVENLSSEFSYTKKQIRLDKLNLKTIDSKISAEVVLNYKIEDFKNFNDKVNFDIQLHSSTISSNDIHCFYKGIGKHLTFITQAILKGTLNDLTFSNLKLTDSKNTYLKGRINLKNSFGKADQRFYMNIKFDKFSSSYQNLVTLLPNVLGKKLPQNIKKLGVFDLFGDSQTTANTIIANLNIKTDLGNIKSKLDIKGIDFIDKASYKGNLILDNFDLGAFFERTDVKKATVDIDIDGVGFSKKYLNTSIAGNINQINYNDYNYSNIKLNGDFKLPLYKGQISINDPNLNLDFEGLIDLSAKENKYDFHVNVKNADLNKLKFIKDSTSILKGDIVVQASGNSIENIVGKVYINNTVYQNQKRTYIFDDLNINSSFDQNQVRSINVNSPDVVEGIIIGKYKFSELKKLVTNSLGSLYANYKPLKVNKDQFLKFDFVIYNKIIELFFPEINIGSNTMVKGNINSNIQEFKLDFNSPQITAFANVFDNIKVKIDNKNPLYNAYVEMDSIKTKYYKIRDFSLINVTMKDTLFFRSEFKGGKKGQDYYNLNLFHTINKENKNVIGISKSEVKFKDYLWFLNENENQKNQIVFDKSLQNFNFNDIILTHNNQEIIFKGDVKGPKFKDLKVSLKNVDLNQITPTNPKFVFNGNINALVNFKQDGAVFRPTASILIDHLDINKTPLGDLNFDIFGDESFKKFSLNATIKNDNLKPLNATGNFEIVNNSTVLDLNLKLDNFNLGVLSSLGGDVISNIRGFVSGNASIGGNINKPDINGRLYLEKGGLTIPYLNVDYELKDKSIVDITSEKFIFRKNILTDSKYVTIGVLNGNIQHNVFSDWKLDLNISSKRLLVLNTIDHEDAAYYGTAFIDGNATIKGPTNELFIKVDAKSEKGSSLKIPINDVENISENNFIHFLSPKEKYNLKKGIVEKNNNYMGLELEFDLDITPNAEVEVILDRVSGHGMKGRGSGTLLFKINTLGKFNMWGDFQAYEGSYNFKYGGIIDRKFDVKKGGYISWEGDPLKARLNLEAVYKTSANPALLLENSSLNKKVPVELIIGVRGDLASPEPDFNFEFPTISSVLKSEIQYKLNDKDVRQTQALYLLSAGGFLSSEGVTQSDFSRSIFETATGLLGGIIKTNNDKFKVDFNVISADRRIGKESDGRFVANISSRINERITFNGKVGVPFGGINETGIIGDVEIQYRVNQDGTLNLKMFNRENDINYIGQGIVYTQGLGLSYEIDFDNLNDLVNKVFNKIKSDTKIKSGLKDKGLNDINFENLNSKSSKPKIILPILNKEGIIPEE
ncbi:translocation/assembly module TamB domain-containing protein [Flavobacterium sp.]|uniref:translocation/assembly module TamB domain-containing protein n=1 Tax=Flavobacterium sp. TaxID=239 RepID=UPI0038FCB849